MADTRVASRIQQLMYERQTRKLKTQSTVGSESSAISPLKVIYEKSLERERAATTACAGKKFRIAQMKTKKGNTEVNSPTNVETQAATKRQCFFKVGHSRKPVTGNL